MIQKKNALRVIVALAMLSLSSCVTSGREFVSRLDWVQKGKTRQGDVKLVLGRLF